MLPISDAANIENVDPVKKHYSAPEYLEKRKTRRKSGNLIPDFSLLRSQRAKKGTRKSIDMTSSPKSVSKRTIDKVGLGGGAFCFFNKFLY